MNYLRNDLYFDAKSIFHGMKPPYHGVYVVRVLDENGKAFPRSKIGVTSHPIARLNSIQAHNPFEVKYSWFHETEKRKDAMRLEAVLHAKLERWRIHGEWFRMRPSSAVEVLFDVTGGDENWYYAR